MPATVCFWHSWANNNRFTAPPKRFPWMKPGSGDPTQMSRDTRVTYPAHLGDHTLLRGVGGCTALASDGLATQPFFLPPARILSDAK